MRTKWSMEKAKDFLHVATAGSWKPHNGDVFLQRQVADMLEAVRQEVLEDAAQAAQHIIRDVAADQEATSMDEPQRVLLIPTSATWRCPVCDSETEADLSDHDDGVQRVPDESRYQYCEICGQFVDIGWGGWACQIPGQLG